MRGRLIVTSFVLCFVLASEAPAQGASRGGGMRGGGGGMRGGFNGGRGLSGGGGSFGSRSSFGGGSRSFGGGAAPRASSGGFNWRSNSAAGAARSVAPSTAGRSASGFSSRSAPRTNYGGVSGTKFYSGRSSGLGRSGSLGASSMATAGRGASRSNLGAGTSSTDTLSPFARGLQRSSSGSRYFGRSTSTATGRGAGTTASGRSSAVGSTAGSARTGSRFIGRDANTTTARGTGAARSGRSAAVGDSAGSAASPRTATGRGTTGRSPGSDQVPANATGRRAGQVPGTDAATVGTGRGATGRSVGASQVGDPAAGRRYGYYPRSYSTYPNCYGYGYGYGCGSGYYCSPYYSYGGFYLGFTFGFGAYAGLSYYYPWYHCGSNYAFFYGAPLSYCYVPYGFYCDAPATYVTRYVYVEDTYPTTDYEAVEAAPPAEQPAEGQQVVEPQPAASTPVAEKYLRDASDAFRKADYLESAKLFRLAALSAPENAAPLFALGQALVGLGSDAYAAKVIRKAVLMSPGLVREPGDIVGVFKSQEEFDRVMGELRGRAEQSPAGSDARFLLAAERYFSGDPKALEGFLELRAALPGDEAVALFVTSAEKRFANAGELPPVEATPK